MRRAEDGGFLQTHQRIAQGNLVEDCPLLCQQHGLYFNLATDRQISLMYHKRARTRKKWYRIILRRIGRFMKESVLV